MGKDQRVSGCRSLGHRQDVLDPDRDAVQRPAIFASGALGVGLARGGQRVVVHPFQVDAEPPVERVGTPQRRGQEFYGRELAGTQRSARSGEGGGGFGYGRRPSCCADTVSNTVPSYVSRPTSM